MEQRKPFDLGAYVRDIGSRPCFICELMKGNPEYRHHIVAEDAQTIIFCPKAHVEDLADELSEAAYLRLQATVHRLSRALKRVFEAERIYVLSLGSQQANRHLHFHVVPLPKGVPLEQQQYHALMAEHGVLQLPDEEMAAMAVEIGAAYRAISTLA